MDRPTLSWVSGTLITHYLTFSSAKRGKWMSSCDSWCEHWFAYSNEMMKMKLSVQISSCCIQIKCDSTIKDLLSCMTVYCTVKCSKRCSCFVFVVYCRWGSMVQNKHCFAILFLSFLSSSSSTVSFHFWNYCCKIVDHF